MSSIDWANDSAATIRTQLLTPVWVPTNAAVTVAEIVEAVGKDAARLVIGTLQAGAAQDPLLASSSQAISTVGMRLSSIDRQEMIDQLAIGGEWPDAVRDAVKALGGAYVGRWSQEGFDDEPTLEQVAARKSREIAIASTAERINAASEARRAAVDNAASTGDEIITATEEAFG